MYKKSSHCSTDDISSGSAAECDRTKNDDVSVPAFAFKTLLQIETLLALWRTSVMSVFALVFRRAANVVPREI